MVFSCVLTDLPTSTDSQDTGEVSIPDEVRVPKHMLTELINETAKLKESDVTRQVPVEKLGKLMLVLFWNVKDGSKLVPSAVSALFNLYIKFAHVQCHNL